MTTRSSLQLFTLRPGLEVQLSALKNLLPSVEAALFFAKLYKLDYTALSELMLELFDSEVMQALLNDGQAHSVELQSYLVDVARDTVIMQRMNEYVADPKNFDQLPPYEFLPELLKSLEITVAKDMQELADTVSGSMALLQGKQGKMMFQSMHKLNKQRQHIIGSYEAQIKHPVVPNNLVIFDVSGSVSPRTVKQIVNEVVAFAYQANAALAIVSDNTFLWESGDFSVDAVLRAAEYGGTHYETLRNVMNRNWDSVFTIADYDSSLSAKEYLESHCTGHIRKLYDISLVNRPTFLGECLESFADECKPLLVSRW